MQDQAGETGGLLTLGRRKRTRVVEQRIMLLLDAFGRISEPQSAAATGGLLTLSRRKRTATFDSAIADPLSSCSARTKVGQL